MVKLGGTEKEKYISLGCSQNIPTVRTEELDWGTSHTGLFSNMNALQSSSIQGSRSLDLWAHADQIADSGTLNFMQLVVMVIFILPAHKQKYKNPDSHSPALNTRQSCFHLLQVARWRRQNKVLEIPDLQPTCCAASLQLGCSPKFSPFPTVKDRI